MVGYRRLIRKLQYSVMKCGDKGRVVVSCYLCGRGGYATVGRKGPVEGGCGTELGQVMKALYAKEFGLYYGPAFLSVSSMKNLFHEIVVFQGC